MYLTIISIPVLSSLIGGLFGRKIGTSGVQILMIYTIAITTILAIVAFFEIGFSNSPVSIDISSWISSELLDVTWSFSFDSLTVSILLAVLIVSTLVHVYSVDYIAADPHITRFFIYLTMFTFFMLVLVTGDNYLILFIGHIPSRP